MSYQLEIKIEDEHFYEDNGSPQPCEEVDTFEQYLEFLEQEEKDAVTEAYGNGPHGSKYYTTTIGVSSNGTVVAAKIKQGDDCPKKPKLEPEFEPIPSHRVLVGCTTCYKYMVVSSSNCACSFCHQTVHTIEELV